MEAPRGALRLYNADELEPLSRAGLEALLMEIQDDYHRREGEDQLYLDATKPIRAFDFDFCLSTSTRFDSKHIRSCLASRRSVSGWGLVTHGAMALQPNDG